MTPQKGAIAEFFIKAFWNILPFPMVTVPSFLKPVEPNITSHGSEHLDPDAQGNVSTNP
jgi:hypothetical protein